jgi:histidinol-phosphate aminotransferase
VNLDHHGDAEVAGEVGSGLLDLAVNVRGPAPSWLREVLSRVDLTAYPVPAAARAAVALRHGRPAQEVLLTAGTAEAFVLVARLPWRRAVVVHPQFTEPEAALRAAGHAVSRVELHWPYTLDLAAVPEDADLVVVGNPTNPTSVLHPANTLLALRRPGRTLVVDEAFMDCTDERFSLTGRDGVVVLRSLTKTWGLAGLRCGYLLGPAALVARLGALQPLWPVSTPALAAIEACCAPDAVAEASGWAAAIADDRKALLAALDELDVEVVPDPAASFLLLRHPGDLGVWRRLRAAGIAARRGDTFPGLDSRFLRVAVRTPEVSAVFAAALAAAL